MSHRAAEQQRSGGSGSRDATVLVVGEALIDIVERDGERVEHVGGSPANVALGLGRLGIDVDLLTQVAEDDRGRRIIAHLERSGARVLNASPAASRTSTALARIMPDGHAEYEFDVIWDALALEAGRLDAPIVHTGSLAAFVEPGAGSVRELLTRLSPREVTFDPNIRPALLGSHGEAFPLFERMARLSTVVKMSDEDAAWLYPGRSVDEVVASVVELGPHLVMVTLGGEGAVIANRDHVVRIPVPPTSVVDTVGAGDTVMASVLAALVRTPSRTADRRDMEAIGQDAVRAAAVTVSRAGADLPWASELRTP